LPYNFHLIVVSPYNECKSSSKSDDCFLRSFVLLVYEHRILESFVLHVTQLS